MLEGILQIHTLKGSYFYNSNEPVYVHAGFEEGSDVTLEKRARDLNTGDLVLVHAESIDIPLDDIKRDLDELDPMYHRARSTVLSLNNESEEVPFFRRALLEGFARTGLIEYDEDSIMMNGDSDFSSEDYSRMASHVEGLLDGTSRSTIMNWLKGDVLAPRDWSTFDKLRSIDERLGDVYDTQGDGLGFRSHYNLYVGSHKFVRRSLAGLDNSEVSENDVSSKNGDSSKSRFSRSYGPQIRAIFDKYAYLLEDNVMAVRVKGVSGVESKRKKERFSSKSESASSRGIVSEWEANPGDINYQILSEQLRVLSHFFNAGVSRYKRLFNIGINTDYDNDIFPLLEERLFGDSFTSYSSAPWGSPQFSESAVAEADEFIAKYREGLLDGEMGVPVGAWDGLITANQRVRRLVPNALHVYRAEVVAFTGFASQLAGHEVYSHLTDRPKSSRRKFRDLEKTSRKLAKSVLSLGSYLSSTYDISLRGPEDSHEILRQALSSTYANIYEVARLLAQEEINRSYPHHKNGVAVFEFDSDAPDSFSYDCQILEDAGAPLAKYFDSPSSLK